MASSGKFETSTHFDGLTDDKEENNFVLLFGVMLLPE